MTEYWYAEHERSPLWNDSTINISCSIEFELQLAVKDAAANFLADIDT